MGEIVTRNTWSRFKYINKKKSINNNCCILLVTCILVLSTASRSILSAVRVNVKLIVLILRFKNFFFFSKTSRRAVGPTQPNIEWVPSSFAGLNPLGRTLNHSPPCSRLRLKCDGTCSETVFRLSEKKTSPFKSAGASVQSTTGSRGVRISCSHAGYTMFRGSVKSTGYTLHSPVSPSLPLPCFTVCRHISAGV